MAIIDTETDHVAGKSFKVDIASADAPKGIATKIDTSADAFERQPPPPKGYYKFELNPSKNGWQGSLRDEKDKESISYSTSLECQVMEGEYKGRNLFQLISTRVFAGRETSTAATMLVKLGAKVVTDQAYTDLAIARGMDKRLNKGAAILWAETDWLARGTEISKRTSEKVYFDVKRGMDNFPEDDEGNKSPIVRDKNGVECYASWYALRWYNQAEYDALIKGGKGVSKGTGKGKDDIVVDDVGNGVTGMIVEAAKEVVKEVVKEAATTQAAMATAPTKSAKKAVVADEDALFE